MDNFDNDNFQPFRVSAPEGMYSQVRERIIQERVRIAKTRQQLAVGAALLLIVGAVNIGIVVFSSRENTRMVQKNAEKVLYETYFDNQIPLSK